MTQNQAYTIRIPVAPHPFSVKANPHKHTNCGGTTPSPSPLPPETPPPYQIHGCGYPCNDSNDCDSPCTVCCANQTCCYDVPSDPSPPPPAPAPAPVLGGGGIGVPHVPPPPGHAAPPYQVGCGYPCSDSNDCDWPCTVCCANQSCCYDVPFDDPSLPPSAPASAAVLPPSPEYAAPPNAWLWLPVQ